MTHIAVVVPAHNEQERLAGCLASIAVAADLLRGVRVDVVVVLDRCTDATARVAAAAGARTVSVDAGNVGRARAVGVTTALRAGAAGLWVATTDADTRVPADWLRSHLAHAGAGADVVAGTVAIHDWSDWTDDVAGPYRRGYEARCDRRGHGHVHGANLGVRGSAYLRVGGFRARAVDEDRGLVDAAIRSGLTVTSSLDSPVVTSARPVSRVDHGFAGHLRSLRPQGR